MTTTTVTVSLKETASAGFKKIASAVSKAASAANQAGESFAGLGKSIGKAGASAVKSGKAIGGGIGKGTTAAAAGIQNLDAKLSELSLSGSFAGGVLQTIATGLFEFSAASIEAFGSAQRLGTATDGLAKSVGLVGDELVDAIIETSGGTVDALTAMGAANKALSFGIITSNEEMEILTKTAKVLGPALGQTVAKALDDVTIGLGRNSKLILDNLGIIVSATVANEKYAESLGVSASKLSDEQKTIAFRTEALMQMTALTDRVGEGEEGLADKTEKAGASFVNLKIAIGELISQPVGEFLDEITGGIQRLTEGAQAWRDITQELIPEMERLVDVGLLEATNKQIAANKQQLGLLEAASRQQLHLSDEQTASSKALLQNQKILIAKRDELLGTTNAENKSLETNSDLLGDVAGQTDKASRATADFSVQQSLFAIQAEQTASSIGFLLDMTGKTFDNMKKIGEATGGEGIFGQPLAFSTVPTPPPESATEAAASKAAKDFASSFNNEIEQQRGQIESIASQVLGDAFGATRDLGLSFLQGDTEEGLGEDARRLAVIAEGRFEDEAAKLFAESNPELFKKIMSSEDPAAVAQDILKKLDAGIDEFGLIDREKAKERIKNIFLGGEAQNSLIQELTAEVAKELGVGIAQVQATVSGELGGATEEISATLPADEVLQQTDLIKSELEQIGIAGQETANMLDDSMTSITDNLFLVEEGGLRIKAIFLDIAAAAGSMTGAISGASSAVGIPNAAAGDSGGGGSASANAGGSFLAVGSNAGANLGGSSLVANAGNQAPATTAQQTRPMIINLTMESGGQAMATWVSGEIGEDITQQAQVTGKDPRF